MRFWCWFLTGMLVRTGWAATEFFLGSHTSAVTAVAFSPNGMFLASGAEDTTVKLWNLQTKRTAYTLSDPRRHRKPIRAVGFTTDGSTLLSGDAESRLVRWTLATGYDKGVNAVTVPVSSLGFSPDGQLLAIGMEDGTLACGAATGLSFSYLNRALRGRVAGVFWEEDNNHFIGADTDGNWSRWTLKPGTRFVRPAPDEGKLPPGKRLGGHPLALTPDRSVLGVVRSVAGAGRLSLFRFPGGERIADPVSATLPESAELRSVAFSPDGQTAAAGGSDGRIYFWDLTPQLAAAGIAQAKAPSPVTQGGAAEARWPRLSRPIRAAGASIPGGADTSIVISNASPISLRIGVRRIENGQITGEGVDVQLPEQGYSPDRNRHRINKPPSGEYALFWCKTLEPGIIHQHPEPIEVFFKQTDIPRGERYEWRSVVVTLDGTTVKIELDERKNSRDRSSK